jgi:hypothetical protein
VTKATDHSAKTVVLASDHRTREEVERTDEPPVIARLIVEIRSDGSRTIARGALEDAQRGDRVAIEARGDSPLQLAIALARSLTQLPRLSARSAVRGLLGKRRDK